MAITLHEVLSKALQFNNGVYIDLPPSIKFILDNLQKAYTKNNYNLFQRTLRALELHLVELEAGKTTLISQLFGKENIHSMDKMTIMGTDYARLSLKTQNQIRSVVANLPTDIQVRILGSKAMSESCDQWFKHFKILVTSHFPVYGEDLDDIHYAFIQSTWDEYFGSSHRVYEKKHHFPGLIVNYEDGADDEDRDPSWLSRMFEYGFIRLIKLTSHNQINQFPQIIQQVVTKIKSPFVSIRCWSTLPQWDRNNWMIVQPTHHLVLINEYTHNGPWYDGDSYLSYEDPYVLAGCWKDYFNNELLDVTSELWKNYHFTGNTGRISVFTTKPYSEAFLTQRLDNIDPSQLTTQNADHEPLLYCGFCNLYDKYHEHDCDYHPPWDPYDGYPSDVSD